MRLRTLSEAECYARCYGGRGEERVSFVRTVHRRPVDADATAERLRALVELGFEPDEGQEEAA